MRNRLLTLIFSVIIAFASLFIGLNFGFIASILSFIVMCLLGAHILFLVDTIKKYPNYYNIWETWYKKSLNHPLYKFLVLIRLTFSPTFEIELVMSDSKQDWGINYTKDIDREKCVISVTNAKNFFDEKGDK